MVWGVALGEPTPVGEIIMIGITVGVIAYELYAKGEKQRIRDSELENLPDEEISRRARDKSLSPDQRRRYQKEEKARRLRDKRKRCK